MPPRNPQPGHPLADAARDEADQIAAMAAIPPTVVPVPDLPADPPSAASPPQLDTPPTPDDAPPGSDQPPATEIPPLDPRYVERIVQQNDTLLGRLEAEGRARREAEEAARAALSNREFTERRLQELSTENARTKSELAKIAADRDANEAVKDFKGEHVDPDAFGEIYRGIHPHLQRLEANIQTRIDEAVNARVKEAKTESEKREADLRKELNEKAIMRDVPAFGKLIERPDFKDFLAETVPGTRTTRRAEVLGAWRDGDTKFIHDVVEQFKLRGAPRAVDNEPVNHGRQPQDQSPRSPSPEPRINEDTLTAAFEQMNQGVITVEKYRGLKKLYDKQQLEAWRQSKRAN